MCRPAGGSGGLNVNEHWLVLFTALVLLMLLVLTLRTLFTAQRSRALVQRVVGAATTLAV